VCQPCLICKSCGISKFCCPSNPSSCCNSMSCGRGIPITFNCSSNCLLMCILACGMHTRALVDSDPWQQSHTKPMIFLAGLPRFLQTKGCAKQKSVQRSPTIRFTDSVCIEDRKFDNFFTVRKWRWWWRFEHLPKYCNLSGVLNIPPNTKVRQVEHLKNVHHRN